MKKIAKLLCLISVCFLFSPTVQAIEATKTEYVACGDATGIPAPIPQLTSIAYTLLITTTPVILIVFSIIALVKATTAGSQDEIMKAKGKLIKKFITAAVVFFVAGIVQFVVTKAADTSEKGTISKCVSCFLYNSNCDASEDPYTASDLIDKT